ncbi:hypothetical protein CMO94_00605 [Candidatus Woesearchaeota archaeon]|jgi:radical SAM superfamily enzyme YgiQ (UPF0313 family)|nr:hypothetical protein [Candidatus Woesearchaeota archaeon]MDP7244678.1 radical SAM protein [Flavobacteriales bacterium]
MIDIILFQPKCGVWDIMGARVPIGLLSIGAVPCNKGYKVVLIDQRIDFDWQSKIKKYINQGAKIVCLTTMVGEQILHMMEVSKFIKSIDSNILTILGGSWPQTQPEMCMQDKNIDVVCYGEGDYLLTELMAYCEGKKKISDVLGIIHRTKEGTIKRTAPRQPVQNLDELPKIPYRLVNLRDYTAVGFRQGKPSISVVTSRGCQFRCTFCSMVPLYGQSWRGYSVDRLMEDIAELESKYGIKDFFFNDDLITGDFKRFTEFLEALAKSGRDYNWGTPGMRGDAVLRLTKDEKAMDNLIKSGCKNLDIGVESGSPRILKLIKKDTTVDVIRRVNQKMSKYPVIMKYNFMGGFPTETEGEFFDTMRLRRILQEENEYAIAPIYFFTPVPETQIFTLAIENGFQPPTKLQEWADFNYDTWYKKYPSWLTKRMIHLIDNAVFLSYFSNKKMSYKYPNPLLNILFKLYYPLAKLRNDNDYYGFMFEKSLAEFIVKIDGKFNLFNRIQKKFFFKKSESLNTYS